MNTAVTKLTIRTQLPLIDTSDKPVPPDEVVYLWGRIITASLVTTLLICALGFGVWRWLHQSASTPDTLPSLSNSIQESLAEPTSTTVESVDLATKVAAQQAEAQALDTPHLESPPQLNRAPAPAVDEPNAQPNERTKEESNGATAIVTVAPSVTKADNTVGTVKILSTKVTRAYLSQSKHQQNPTDRSPKVFSLSDEGLVKVYFMTELAHLKGQTIHYNWYLGKKLMAKVVSRPISDPAKAFSSKFMDRGMLGQWHVELNGEDGATLARADFEVR